ncbi:MAG: ATP-dependent RecD-like DNA helicase [Lachnospiraceae bacterium]|nr:ATP-dependent RecD-like DNA helicase [Lachnospiraceae bacterium]MBQ4068817.1 ATP-dependent RecD-like DNA helicase [Lachnospiraceae bacterium]
MLSLEGYIEKIVYRNEENGYTVFTLVADGEEITGVGTFSYIAEGECVEISGEYIEHVIYGTQFKVENLTEKAPEDEISIARYLGSGAIKGIGAVMADKIVRKFGKDTFRIIEEEPEKLAEVKGISLNKAMDISAQIETKKDMRKAMIFLGQYGISLNLAIKIYNRYGMEIYSVIKTNPYKMADDIDGVGFKIADEIAQRVGIHSDSDFRIQSGILYTLQCAGANGHVYLPENLLIEETVELLGVKSETVAKHLMDMVIDKKIVIKEYENEGKIVYASVYYYTEMNIAAMLKGLNVTFKTDESSVINRLEKIEKNEEITLDDIQREAVIETTRNGLMVITGGPGTGKTTTINNIIKFFESEEMDILLAAPTGRAAKRMTEATGYEAQTIHRLLELSAVPEDGNARGNFERNENNPLEADVIIIDEMSMVDMFLMNALLKAIIPGTRLILVGDVNQLPSVGPGNVLRDIIESDKFKVVRLTKIFRQAGESGIVVNAHRINKGEKVMLDNSMKDFLFMKRPEADAIISASLTLIKDKLPKYVNASMQDIQVLTPMRKGLLGVERINEILQKYLNPPSDNKREHETVNGIFREGDKVMQIKNDYQLEWEIRNKYNLVTANGLGVFNGDTGVIRTINTYNETLEVEFEEKKMVSYTFKQLDELELAYAVTIHKSQGSEYPAVIIPLLTGPRLLMNRNLLYTAVTRAKKCVCIVGSDETFNNMVANENEQKRYSGLKYKIIELWEG